MEFWGVEVKAGESLKVQPELGKLIHISQAALGEVKDVKAAKCIPVRMKIDKDKYVIGTLSAEDRPQVMFDLVFEREFELSHDWKNGSVYFIGYIADDQIQDEQDFSDESDDEEFPIEALENGGKPQLKVEDSKPTKEKAAAATKTETKKEEAPESDVEEDEDDSDDSGSDDLSGGMDSEDLMDDSDDSSDEETPKAQQPKKRPSSVLETPVSNKKAKLATTPSKTGNKSVHTATPYPSKKAGKGNKTK
ncbi:histone deacetylase HDT1-like [Olea europaea var. sylvestris]|uniref:histone deacetylase HDT1-like n=1 Tax=Olea europaea var. sylvestris TaxID=158386 RepID=UPI000C1D81E0|nr:histone deacetylase HDT1-like [Olea europaea var. sylvestris]